MTTVCTRTRLAVDVLYGDLTLGIRTRPVHLSRPAELSVLAEELCENRMLMGISSSLVASVPEHHSLVPSTLFAVQTFALGHALGDVRALLLEGDLDTAGVSVKALGGVVVPDFVDHASDQGGVVDGSRGSDLSGDDDEACLREFSVCNPGVSICGWASKMASEIWSDILSG